MTTHNESKLMTLVKSINPGSVALASWLETKGISRNLLWHYLQSGWLEPIGRGAYKRWKDRVSWKGGIIALQTQTSISVHVGALSALAMQGQSHYLRLADETVYLFSPYKVRLPKWFLEYNWGVVLFHQQSSFLPEKLGLTTINYDGSKITISTQERAILECLYLAPKNTDLIECYHLMESLVNLTPKLMHELLSNCNSIKVKRLFLYLSEKVNHQWFNFLNTSNIELGSGNRSIAKNGVYISKYQLTVPKELADL